MFINHSSKEVTAKIVYYGPGLSGKTTCIQYIFSVTNPNSRGELISIETEIERTLFFDLLPVNVGLVKGYQTKFQLYTVPGQVFYDSTRKLVLKGADGVVFVADSQMMMENQNLDSLKNLKKNLNAHKLDINDIPMVFQYNKRDLGNILPLDKLNKILNPKNYPYFASIATKGDGVIEALREISNLILRKIKSLLDQAEERDAQTPRVEFDTNKKLKIINKEQLPLRKIHAQSLDKLDQQLLPEELALKPLEEIEDKQDDEEMLRVETVEEIDDLKDILIDEEPAAPEPYAHPEKINIAEEPRNTDTAEKYEDLDIPEIDEMEEEEQTPPKIGTGDLDTAEYEEMEKLIEKAKEREKEQEKKKTGEKEEEKKIEEDLEPFKGLEDIQINIEEGFEDINGELGATKIEFTLDLDEEIQDLKDIGELVEEGNIKEAEKEREKAEETGETREAEPFKLEKEENLNSRDTSSKEPLKQPFQQPFPEPETIKKPEPVKEIKKEKKISAIPKELELFDQFKDKTRLTIIKAIPVKEKGPEAQLFVDIKDKDSNVLESIKVKVTPEIKKITLILDVKN